MPTVSLSIIGSGSVRVSRMPSYGNSYEEIGVASQPESKWNFGFYDMALFAPISSHKGWRFEKFCSANGKVCASDRSMLEAKITQENDVLSAYFVPVPEPPPQPNPFAWLWNLLFGWWK